MLQTFFKQLFAIFQPDEPEPVVITQEQRAFSQSTMSYYQSLSENDKRRFEHHCSAFITVTEFAGHNLEVSEFDEMLVADSSDVLGFEKLHFLKVDTTYSAPGAFKERPGFWRSDSNITGLVGIHHLKGKMIPSQTTLRQGFTNDADKHNLAIHKLAYLIDMTDGEIDGLPRPSYALPWLNLIAKKIQKIENKKIDIRNYGATYSTEYLFERPKMLKRRLHELYAALEHFDQQNRVVLHRAERIRKKPPCPYTTANVISVAA